MQGPVFNPQNTWKKNASSVVCAYEPNSGETDMHIPRVPFSASLVTLQAEAERVSVLREKWVVPLACAHTCTNTHTMESSNVSCVFP